MVTKKTQTSSSKTSKKSYSTSIPTNIKYLLLHESPGESKTVNQFLPQGYYSMATIWHFLKTSEKDLDIDINTWTQNLKLDPSKRDVISNIQKAIDIVRKNHWQVVLCWDPDREWATINWSVYQYFKLKKGEYVVHWNPTSLVEKEYMKWVNNPKDDLDWDLVSSWHARQILDKYVGYKNTELLWDLWSNYNDYLQYIKTYINNKLDNFETVNKDVVSRVDSVKKIIKSFRDLDFDSLNTFDKRKWTSFGRVQSAWLILLVQKELEKFDKKLEFKLNLLWNDSNWLTWEYIDQESDKLNDIYQDLCKWIKSIRVSNIESSVKKVSPPDTLDTLRAQTSLWSTFWFNLETIMKTLQELYEKGLTTYMRTDTNSTSPAYDEYIKEMLDDINETYIYREYSEKDAQAWHVWILPTQKYDLNTIDQHNLTPIQQDVFEYIVRRTLSAFMEESKIKYTTYTFEVTTSSNNTYTFILKDSDIVEEWFLKVFTYGRDKYNKKVFYNIGDTVIINEWILREKEIKLSWSYTETSFVSELKKNGIGRPSTWASIVSTLKDKEYVKIKDKKLVVTPKWYWVYSIITKDPKAFWRFSQIDFTKQMEDDLDLIAKWKLEKNTMLNSIKDEVESISKNSKSSWGTINHSWGSNTTESCGVCNSCKKWTIEKKQVNGKDVWSCSNWKWGCKFTIWGITAWHTITDDESDYMIKNLESEVIDDFVSKSWKNFSAKLVFNKKKWFEFKFD